MNKPANYNEIEKLCFSNIKDLKTIKNYIKTTLIYKEMLSDRIDEVNKAQGVGYTVKQIFDLHATYTAVTEILDAAEYKQHLLFCQKNNIRIVPNGYEYKSWTYASFKEVYKDVLSDKKERFLIGVMVYFIFGTTVIAALIILLGGLGIIPW